MAVNHAIFVLKDKMSYSFFDYQEFIFINGEKYHGQDYFGLTHIVFMIIATIALILLCVFLRKTSHKKVEIYLKVLAVLVPIIEVVKIVWESYWDITVAGGFDFSGLLPIYTCSMFIYILPISAFAKGKVKECAISWLGTICIFAGFTNFYLTQILHDYPFWTYATFTSLYFHFLMSFTGIFLLVTGYYKPKWIDVIKGYIPLLIFSVLVIPTNYYLTNLGYEPDYMLYMWGNGAPILPIWAKFFSENNLHFLYTLIVVVGYLILSALMVSIEKGIIYLSKRFKKVN